MRICRCDVAGRTEYGLIREDQVELLAAPPFDGIRPTGNILPLSDVVLRAPVDPPNVFAIGTNYQSHIDETQSVTPERPLIFLKATTSVIGPEDAIVLPRMAPDEVDYEAELALIIGKTARHVSPENALDVVLGYTCANDVSARDCQKKQDRQWARAKSFDTFCPLGPWIETDLDPSDLRVRCRLDGRTMQDASTAAMIFDCRTLISYLSQAFTLVPGTVILTGTPDGVGMAQSPEVYLRPGNRVEVQIEGIGTLANPVQAEFTTIP